MKTRAHYGRTAHISPPDKLLMALSVVLFMLQQPAFSVSSRADTGDTDRAPAMAQYRPANQGWAVANEPDDAGNPPTRLARRFGSWINAPIGWKDLVEQDTQGYTVTEGGHELFVAARRFRIMDSVDSALLVPSIEHPTPPSHAPPSYPRCA